MNIVGFNYAKISGEKKRPLVGTVNINNNITIDSIEEAKIGIGGGERQAVKLHFTFKSEYTPGMALLEMKGDVLLMLETKRATEILKTWKDGHKVPSDIAQRVMTQILDRCNIQSLLLAKDLNLPSPVPLPKVRTQTAAPAKAEAKKPAAKKAAKK